MKHSSRKRPSSQNCAGRRPAATHFFREYIQTFEQLFRELAAKSKATLVPMLYKNLINIFPVNSGPNGIHPTVKGSEIIARTLLPSTRTFAAENKLLSSQCLSVRSSHLASWLAVWQTLEIQRSVHLFSSGHFKHRVW